MHMTQMLFLSNHFLINPRNQSFKRTKKSSNTSQEKGSSQDFKDYTMKHPKSFKTRWTKIKYNGN